MTTSEWTDDDGIDVYYDGCSQYQRGGPRPTNPVMAEGWDDAERSGRVIYVSPRRPEGYYHAPVGTFD